LAEICYFADLFEWRMAAKMEHDALSREARFSEDVDTLSAVLGRDERAQPLKDYCIDLLMPGERKSVEPMAAVVAPSRVSAKHRSLLHLLGQAARSDADARRRNQRNADNNGHCSTCL
jgi:SRSO17 transposase